jgi:hypothetical protein
LNGSFNKPETFDIVIKNLNRSKPQQKTTSPLHFFTPGVWESFFGHGGLPASLDLEPGYLPASYNLSSDNYCMVSKTIKILDGKRLWVQRIREIPRAGEKIRPHTFSIHRGGLTKTSATKGQQKSSIH